MYKVDRAIHHCPPPWLYFHSTRRQMRLCRTRDTSIARTTQADALERKSRNLNVHAGRALTMTRGEVDVDMNKVM